jgi:tungstate transport system ATP-binding protein
MAMVFQNPVLLSRTVLANVMYGLQVRGLDKQEAAEMAVSSLENVGLKEKCNQYAPTLSAGEGQRMAFARASVLGAEALFLDEFTANLDPANVALLEKEVVRYNARTGGTVVLATHNLFQAKRIAHRTAVLIGGRVVETGPTVEVFSAPRKKTTRDFITGKMAW